MRVKEYKTKIIIKGTRPVCFAIPRGGATAITIFTKLGKVAEMRDVINLSKFQIN